MNEGQISRVLHLLERIAAALDRAHPIPAPISATQAQHKAGIPIDPYYVGRPTVVWSSPNVGPHDPV